MAGALAAGSYTVTVTDANGCTETQGVTVLEPIVLSSTVSSVNALCNGSSDGSATVSSAGGTAPYTYLWDDGQTTAMAGSLSAGSYTVTITDANGCTETQSATVLEPTALASTVSSTDALCNGSSDGSSTVSSVGGTAPYSYAWSDGQSTATATGLSAGSYVATITDTNGCTETQSATVLEPNPLLVSSISQDSVSCYGLSDGSASINGYGGTGSIMYMWDSTAGSQVNDTALNLSEGVYLVSMIDSNGCYEDTTVTVLEPTPLLVSSISQDSVSCFDLSDGSASVLGMGGTGNINYAWESYTEFLSKDFNDTILTSGGWTTHVLAGTTNWMVDNFAGDVFAKITNYSGGQNTPSDAWFISPAVDLTSTIQPILNFETIMKWPGDSLNLYISTDYDGTSNPTQQGTWTNITSLASWDVDNTNWGDWTSSGDVDLSSYISDSTYISYQYLGDSVSGSTWEIDNIEISETNIQITDSISGLSEGSYFVTMIDGNGCEEDTSVHINEPLPLIFTNLTSDSVSCYGGSDGFASANALGGTGTIMYMWDSIAGNQITDTATSLSAGIYNISAMDANGCFEDTTISVGEPSLITGSELLLVCDSLVWNGILLSSTGIYVDTLQSINGCDSVATLDLTVSDLLFSIDTSQQNLLASVTGGTAPYSYEWNTGDTIDMIIPSANGQYWLIVYDSDLCSGDTVFFDVTYLPNVGIVDNGKSMIINVYPNPTLGNVSIDLANQLKEVQITLYDMYGKLVYLNKYQDSKLIELSLDAPPGIYYLDIKSGERSSRHKIIMQ